MDKGHCKHGEFILTEGCAQCMAERRQAGITPQDDEMEDGLNAEGYTLAKAEELSPETALVLKPGEDIEVHSYYQQALKLQQYAEARVITTLEDKKGASDDLVIISELKKAMEAKRKQYLAPLREQTEAINETYKTLMAPVDAANQTTKGKMLEFDKEQERLRQKQEEINQKRLEAAEAEMEIKGELTESVNLVEVVPKVAKTVSTDMGTSGQRDTWKWEVIDFSLVPDEYKIINAGMLTPVVKASKGKIQIPGVRIFNEPTIAVKVR